MNKELKSTNMTWREHWEMFRYFSDIDIERLLEDFEVEIYDLRLEVKRLEGGIDDMYGEITSLNRELRDSVDIIDELKHDLDELQADLDDALEYKYRYECLEY